MIFFMHQNQCVLLLDRIFYKCQLHKVHKESFFLFCTLITSLHMLSTNHKKKGVEDSKCNTVVSLSLSFHAFLNLMFLETLLMDA